VIAHRGASNDVAEHTLPAYLSAIATGADGLECDVRLTRDGHLVCVHDRTVNRTSNGSGIVSEYDLSALRELDFRSWRDDRPLDPAADSAYLAGVAPDRLSADSSRVLTLETLLGVVADAGRPVRLLIETKHPSRYGAEVERKLVETLHRHRLPDDKVQVTVMSFAALALRRVRTHAPAVPTVYLLELLPPGVGRGRLPFGARIAGPGVGLVRARPGQVPSIKQAGHQVYVWTVNEPDDLEMVLDHQVDGVITDRPKFVLDRLADM
jgi:glycerophosphoryl diester phosphodiesterase